MQKLQNRNVSGMLGSHELACISAGRGEEEEAEEPDDGQLCKPWEGFCLLLGGNREPLWDFEQRCAIN